MVNPVASGFTKLLNGLDDGRVIRWLAMAVVRIVGVIYACVTLLQIAIARGQALTYYGLFSQRSLLSMIWVVLVCVLLAYLHVLLMLNRSRQIKVIGRSRYAILTVLARVTRYASEASALSLVLTVLGAGPLGTLGALLHQSLYSGNPMDGMLLDHPQEPSFWVSSLATAIPILSALVIMIGVLIAGYAASAVLEGLAAVFSKHDPIPESQPVV